MKYDESYIYIYIYIYIINSYVFHFIYNNKFCLIVLIHIYKNSRIFFLYRSYFIQEKIHLESAFYN